MTRMMNGWTRCLAGGKQKRKRSGKFFLYVPYLHLSIGIFVFFLLFLSRQVGKGVKTKVFFLFFFLITVHRDTEILYFDEHCIVLYRIANSCRYGAGAQGGVCKLYNNDNEGEGDDDDDIQTRQKSGDCNTIRVPVKASQCPPDR